MYKEKCKKGKQIESKEIRMKAMHEPMLLERSIKPWIKSMKERKKEIVEENQTLNPKSY
jgi:hypothetical protein